MARNDMYRVTWRVRKYSGVSVCVPRHRIDSTVADLTAKGLRVVRVEHTPIYRMVCHFNGDTLMPDLNDHRQTQQEYQEFWEYNQGFVCFFHAEYMTALELALYLEE